MIEHIVKAGVIEPEQLAEIIQAGQISVSILDATFALPNAQSDPAADYEADHIEGAVFFDVSTIADQDTDLPNMLPSAAQFEESASALGISNNDLVVVYGQASMVKGPARAWWMLKTFGHKNVCVLNGSLSAWKASGYETTTVQTTVKATDFKAQLRPEAVINLAAVLEASNTGAPTILDARPQERFSGAQAEPRAGMRSGHIPGAYNVPCSTLVDSAGKLKPRNELAALFEGFELTQDTPIITSCGSGITACALALGLYHLNYECVRLYDGSWSEWGQEASATPISVGR